MQFFCPVCQVMVEAQPETTITTKLGQTAYKTHCPTCQQDLAAIAAPVAAAPAVEPVVAQSPAVS